MRYKRKTMTRTKNVIPKEKKKSPNENSDEKLCITRED
jgi:hypothetical protein